ncbi:hypothetical protein ACOME3_007489 [Neoechinorhynchus agilis]
MNNWTMRRTNGKLYFPLNTIKEEDEMSSDPPTQSEVEDGTLELESDRPSLTMDYPLFRGWSLWVLDKQDVVASWDEALTELVRCTTIVNFWQAMNYVKLPHNITNGSDYYFFQEGIRPVWEDPANQGGGCWSYVSKTSEELDSVWLETLIGLIGEQFGPHRDLICGIRIQIRTNPGQDQRRDKVTLWTRKPMEGYFQETIGRNWKRLAKLDGPLIYELHGDRNPNTKKGLYKINN